MTHHWVMDNNCVKYYPDPTWQWRVMDQTRILGMCALWPWPWRYMYDLGQGHDTRLGHGQQLCEILSRSNLAVKSYGPDMDLGYVCTVTLTLEIWPWLKVMTHPWVMDNNCVIYYTDQNSGYKVMARTRCEQTDGQTDRQDDSYIPPNLVCRGYNEVSLWCNGNDQCSLSCSLRIILRSFSVKSGDQLMLL